MIQNITEQTFRTLKAKLLIEDVVGDLIKLTKSNGPYHTGYCPFCKEIFSKTFTVSAPKGIFYCFGCHKNGDIISFIALYLNESQVEAINTLAKKYNLIAELNSTEIPSN
jgi:DNA primase